MNNIVAQGTYAYLSKMKLDGTLHISLQNTLHPNPLCKIIKLTPQELYKRQQEQYGCHENNHNNKCTKCGVKDAVISGYTHDGKLHYYPLCYFCDGTPEYELTTIY
jgi:hypothetical protein